MSGGRPGEDGGAEGREARLVLALIAAGTVLRLIAAGAFGLGIDESYMVGHSRHFSWSYVDQPPLHVWLVGAWAKLAGSDAAWVVRLPFVALFAGSTWLMFRVTERMFGARAGLWAALALNLAPVLSFAHGSWVLPDGPLIFLMLAATGVLVRILFLSPALERPTMWWAAAGVLGGLALLAKYHAAFLFLGTLVFMLTVPPARRWLMHPGPWIGAVLAAILFLPVIYWNATHDWAGLSFQSDRLAAPQGVSLIRFIANIGGQAAYLTPWLFVPLAVLLVGALRDGPRAPRTWFFAVLAIGPIVVFTLPALFVRTLPHWPAPGWLFVVPLLGAALARWEGERPRLVRSSAVAAAAVALALYGLVTSHAANGWLARAAPRWFEGRPEPALVLLDWRGLESALAVRGLLAPDTILGAPRWIEAGKLDYALGRERPVLCLCGRPQHFAYRYDLSSFSGRDVLIVTTPDQMRRNADELGARFRAMERQGTVVLQRGEYPALELAVAFGRGLKADGPARNR